MTEKIRLRWKREPELTGLQAVGAGPRPYKYHDGKTEYATVYANGGDWQRRQSGWYWVAHIGSELINTCREPVAELDEAKRQASEWVKARIKP